MRLLLAITIAISYYPSQGVARIDLSLKPTLPEAGFFASRAQRKADRQNLAEHKKVDKEIKYQALIKKYAALNKLDETLIQAIIKVESNYSEKAESAKGAKGLMQVMPFYFKSTDDPFSPEDNIRVGTAFLAELVDYFDNDLDLILAAYNAGLGTVIKYDGIPPYKETIDYVKQVKSLLAVNK